LQYKVLKEGTGPTPKSTDSVTTNYRGTLIDGTELRQFLQNEGAGDIPGVRRDQRLD
jgi:FKBP-type peptidyl-prolyl cis-trans isomerase